MAQSPEPTTFFSGVKHHPSDAIFALTAEYKQDPDPSKVNLGQGTYKDENGQSWVLPSVRAARNILLEKGLDHEYLPILGLPGFREQAARMALGHQLFEKEKTKLGSCQSLSGTGALHLAGLLLRDNAGSELPKVYIPEPTWSNHNQVFGSLGFEVVNLPYYNHKSRTLDFDSYLAALQKAEPGSVVVLHACAHNPTGYDPTTEQWQQVATILKENSILPIFDAAYLGFNSGSVDKDAFAIRYFLGDMNMEAIVCLSFAKNMGLYGERVGCTMVRTSDADSAVRCTSTLEKLQRSEVSNPPAFGAKIAELILYDKELSEAWQKDLVTMSGRISAMRQALYDSLVEHGAPGDWKHLIKQSGMFGFLGLPPDVVQELKEKHHIYMSSNSRVSIAGLNESNVKYVAAAISECVRKSLGA